MGVAERAGMYEQLEQARGRPLLVYVTSTRSGGVQGMISAEAIPEFQDQLEKLPVETKGVDLLVVSNGGDPTVAWRLMSLLRERVRHITVLVPQAAFSAATLLALGADEIVMHPNGNLGPVNPQIVAPKPGGGSTQFAFEDLDGVLTYAKNSMNLTEERSRLHVFDRICQEVGSVTVGFAARRSLLSLAMGEKLLRMHMRGEQAEKAKTIAEALNKQFYDHGYPLSRTEASEILDATMKQAPPDVERLIWDIWRNIEDELKMRVPFDLMAELMAMPGAPQLLDTTTFTNAPTHHAFDFEVITAVLESTRHRSRHVIKGKILVTRTDVLKLDLDNLVTQKGWIQS